MGPIGPYQVWRLIASTLLDDGNRIHEVAKCLGHDASTLMRYYPCGRRPCRRQASVHIAELIAP